MIRQRALHGEDGKEEQLYQFEYNESAYVPQSGMLSGGERSTPIQVKKG
ncbi:MAG: hypothetical protein QRY74_05455 [Chlamydia sp.]